METLTQGKLKEVIADILSAMKVAEQLEMSQDAFKLKSIAKRFIKKLEAMRD
jgi:hypothetical protein